MRTAPRTAQRPVYSVPFYSVPGRGGPRPVAPPATPLPGAFLHLSPTQCYALAKQKCANLNPYAQKQCLIQAMKNCGIKGPSASLNGAPGNLGAATVPEIIEAKAHLIAWGKRSDVSSPLANYGFHESDFLNPTTWTERDGIMLQAFSKWWNASHNIKVPDSVTLDQQHLTALRSLSQGLPAGWNPPPGMPTVSPEDAAKGWACILNCESQFGATSATPDAAKYATCAANCAKHITGGGGGGATPPQCPAGTVWDGTACQPMVNPPPPTPPPAAKKSDNTALIVGGVVVVGALAALALS